MNIPIRKKFHTRFVHRALDPIGRSWMLLLVLLLPALSVFGQAKDEDYIACTQQMTEHFGLKGWLGITPKYDKDGTILVEHVFAGSPAEKAGFRKGDFVRGINGEDRKSSPDKFMEEYHALRPNLAAVFDLERDGRRLSVSVYIEAIPETVLKDWIREECQ